MRSLSVTNLSPSPPTPLSFILPLRTATSFHLPRTFQLPQYPRLTAVDTPTPFASIHSYQPPSVSLTVFDLRAILRPMRVLSVIVLLTALILPVVAVAEVQTLTATHTYVMGITTVGMMLANYAS